MSEESIQSSLSTFLRESGLFPDGVQQSNLMEYIYNSLKLVQFADQIDIHGVVNKKSSKEYMYIRYVFLNALI